MSRDVDHELGKLADPSCGFVRAGKRCNKPGRAFDNRSLCEEHIKEVERQRSKLRRRDVSYQQLEAMHAELARDIEEMKRR